MTSLLSLRDYFGRMSTGVWARFLPRCPQLQADAAAAALTAGSGLVSLCSKPDGLLVSSIRTKVESSVADRVSMLRRIKTGVELSCSCTEFHLCAFLQHGILPAFTLQQKGKGCAACSKTAVPIRRRRFLHCYAKGSYTGRFLK